MQKVLPITIPILYAESIADTNTDTFAKSIGDTFTDTFNVVTSHIRNFTVFESSVCEDYYLVKHDRGSNKYKRNIIKLNESAEDGRRLRARETDSFSC